MTEIIKLIIQNRTLLINKTNEIAGYFDEKKFKTLDFSFKEIFEKELKDKNILITDFSPYVQKICNGNYSKLLLIIILAYSVEI